MTKRIAGQIQGEGMRQIAALFGHSDNAGDAQRDRVSFAGLFLSANLPQITILVWQDSRNQDQTI